MSPDERPALDFSRLRLKSRRDRQHKVSIDALAKTPPPGCTFAEWFAALPDFLGAHELRQVVSAVVAARGAGRPVVFAFGGHVIKTGGSPLVIDLIERGVITALATNGSGAIHDLELAETGATSEDVADTIRDGSFGMVHETCERMNAAAALGARPATGPANAERGAGKPRRGAGTPEHAAHAGKPVGLGRALGKLLAESDAPYKHLSLFAAAYRAGIPATVHVAIGTDTVHMHPQADGAAIGAASLADFHELCAVVAAMGNDLPAPETGKIPLRGLSASAAPRLTNAENEAPGGVWLNFGSAVILPEVFLKAVSVARNLGHPLSGMHTANFDMLRQYRPTQNVITRPVAPGDGHSLVGRHEILLPLLRQALVEALEVR